MMKMIIFVVPFVVHGVWVHKFVPETNIRIIHNGEYKYKISKTPYDVLDFDSEIISFMFYGIDLEIEKYKNTESIDKLLFGRYYLKLNEVINRIEYVINNIK